MVINIRKDWNKIDRLAFDNRDKLTFMEFYKLITKTHKIKISKCLITNRYGAGYFLKNSVKKIAEKKVKKETNSNKKNTDLVIKKTADGKKIYDTSLVEKEYLEKDDSITDVEFCDKHNISRDSFNHIKRTNKLQKKKEELNRQKTILTINKIIDDFNDTLDKRIELDNEILNVKLLLKDLIENQRKKAEKILHNENLTEFDIDDIIDQFDALGDLIVKFNNIDIDKNKKSLFDMLMKLGISFDSHKNISITSPDKVLINNNDYAELNKLLDNIESKENK